MFIDMNEIRPDGASWDEELRLPDLEGRGGERQPVRHARIVIRASRGDRGIDVRGRLDAEVIVTCARCLEEIVVRLEPEFFLTLVHASAEVGRAEGSEVEVTDDDAALFPVEEGRASLAEIAAEQIYLNLPARSVCRSDCRGLCPECGANRNREVCDCSTETVDPRLAPLMKLKRP